MSELYEVTGVSKHDRCFSTAVFGMTGVGCKCKYDTLEAKVVGTNNYRTWLFPKDHCPFTLGQQATDEEISRARTTNAVTAFEDAKEERRKEHKIKIGTEKGA